VSERAARERSSGPPVALTIAGSDCSGGAGIQADLKTLTVHGVYGASVITALTAQNSRGVFGIEQVPAEFVGRQIETVLADLEVVAAKTGMLGSAEIIEVVASKLESSFRGALVVDPVMIATSGDPLIDEGAVEALMDRLVPHATLITPNLAEAAVLSGCREASSIDQMEEQGRLILQLGARGVLVKGGHGGQAEAIDVLVTDEGVQRFSSPRIETPHTHGSGCTLSAAITARLALGAGLHTAISSAKAFVTAAMKGAAVRPVGGGCAPLDHLVGTSK